VPGIGFFPFRIQLITLGRVSDWIEQMDAVITGGGLLPDGERILVAVSGGVDSVTLLHLLHALAGAHGWRIEVAHFNHRLRGAAGDADERFVKRLCQSLKLRYHAGRGDTRALARRKKISVEMAARELRHSFLARVARRRGIRRVALAHHADDQLETLFLRLARGMGGESLGGMAPRSPSPADAAVELVRPFLNERRKAIAASARRSRLRWREDRTNRDGAMLRNRIRRQLLPALARTLGEDALASVLQAMSLTSAEAQWADMCARAWLRWPGRKVFEALHPAVQRQVIRRQLPALGLRPSFQLIERLRRQPGGTVSAGERFVRRDAATGELSSPTPDRAVFRASRRKIAPDEAGSVEFGGACIQWRVRLVKRAFRRPVGRAGREFFDADKVGARVELRHWRAGDRFQPIGMGQKVKLQDLFVNGRIPAARRRELVLAAGRDGTIFWVEGLRIGEAGKVTAQTRRVLAWQWKRAQGPGGS
jgi:tRNA(Ile)-lysidine synthase